MRSPVPRQTGSDGSSHWREFHHFAGALSPSLLERLLEGEGVWSRPAPTDSADSAAATGSASRGGAAGGAPLDAAARTSRLAPLPRPSFCCTPLSLQEVLQCGWRGDVSKMTVSPTARGRLRSPQSAEWAGASIVIERECQQNGSRVDGYGRHAA